MDKNLAREPPLTSDSETHAKIFYHYRRMAVDDIQAYVETELANLEKLFMKLAKKSRRLNRSNQRLQETIDALNEPMNFSNFNEELQTRVVITVGHITEDPLDPIDQWDWIGLKFETIANLRPHDLQSKQTLKVNTDELFTHDEVIENVTLGVANVNTNPTIGDFDFEHTLYDKGPFDFTSEHSKETSTTDETESRTVMAHSWFE